VLVKIKGPEGSPPPAADPAAGAATGGASAPHGAAFHDSLAIGDAAGAAAGDQPAAVAAAPEPALRDIAAALRSGSLSGREALERLIDRAVERIAAPGDAGLRQRLRTALRDLAASDPPLAEKIRRLDAKHRL
jgi:hypothetical protein